MSLNLSVRVGALALVVLTCPGCRTDEALVTPPDASLDVVAVSNGTTVYALTTSSRLIRFSASNACAVQSEAKVTGLQEGESLLGIDFRPATGELYGLGSTSRIYIINLATAAATQVGIGPFTPALVGNEFGFDVNPVVDRIRIVGDWGQNLRVNPTTGAVQAVDLPLSFAPGDANAGATPSIVGAAYTNPDNDPATGTTLYDIDSGLDILATQNPPNDGRLNTVGGLSVNTSALVGFDIATNGTAYAALKAVGRGTGGRICGNSDLYSINLATGATIRIGSIGTNAPIRGLAIPTL